MKRHYIRWTVGLLAVGGGARAIFGGSPSPEQETQEKKPFFITTARFSQLQEQPVINKNGKLLGEQSVTVTSQVNGRVASINNNIGDTVQKDTIIVELEDNSGTYTFQAEKAKAALDKARINYESTMLSLDKAVTDARLALERSQSQYNSASSDLGDSATNIQIDKAERELEKSKFDYQKTIESDQQTIRNHIETTKRLTNEVKSLYDDVINEADSLLGVTQLNKHDNDSFEDVLGARNTQTKREAEDELRRLVQKDEQVQQLSLDLTQDELITRLQTLKNDTYALADLLSKVDEMLKNTVTNTEFTSSDLSTAKSDVSTLQTSVETKISTLTTQINTIETFLNTYRQDQQSLAKSVEIAEQQRDLLIRNLRDTETESSISLDSAQTAYQNAQENRTTTQQSLRNAIEQAQISYNEAQKKLSQLQVEAPINGTIGDIMVDVGEEVGVGSPLFTMQSNEQPEIQISLGQEELDYVQPGQSVRIITDNKTYTGTLGSISKTATSNFTYQAIITLNQSVQRLGNLAKIEIPIKVDQSLLPIAYVEVINRSLGEIVLYHNGELETKTVDLGKVRGSLIEIDTDIDPEALVVTSSVKNYDPTEFTLNHKEDTDQ